MKRALVLYVPVLHIGYLKVFQKYGRSVDALYLLGDDIVADFFSFHKEIRALDAATAKNGDPALTMHGQRLGREEPRKTSSFKWL